VRGGRVNATTVQTQAALEQFKESAALAAAERVESGMIVGLGSGTTAAHVTRALGARVKRGLKIIGIPTSNDTGKLGAELGIPISSLDEHETIDLTIDGADEVEMGTLHLIKGHGGALLHEKIVASISKRLVIVVDETKLVGRLGTREALPVEVIPFGWKLVAGQLSQMGAEAVLRLDSAGRPFVTDSGHYIVDCKFAGIAAPADLGGKLDSMVGLVEHGLFLGMASEVIVGRAGGVTAIQRENFQSRS
jgi:ribose 5-phosphate isomerase A